MHSVLQRADLPTVDRQAFRDAMACLGAAVNVVTTDGPQGRAGFTATAVCSVSDEPPTLLVCLNRGSSVHPLFLANRTLCVNVLASDQAALSNLFAGRTSTAERFAGGQWTTLASGAPVLESATVSFDCTIDQVASHGTHDVLFCRVLAVRGGDTPSSLVYFNRRYHELHNG